LRAGKYYFLLLYYCFPFWWLHGFLQEFIESEYSCTVKKPLSESYING